MLYLSCLLYSYVPYKVINKNPQVREQSDMHCVTDFLILKSELSKLITGKKKTEEN